MKSGIIIFIRNTVTGKVKTRIAQSLGDEQALSIYEFLLTHTRAVTSRLSCDKFLYYSDWIQQDDSWKNELFHKRIQQAGDLGERMSAAFSSLFDEGYEQLLIIGSDCIELDESVIKDAFKILGNHEAVIGPSSDGGYYLLGITCHFPQLFSNKKWSSSTVLEDTLKDFKNAGLTVALLPILNDIDEEKDVPGWMMRKIEAGR